MKKMTLYTLAILLALTAVAVPASAGNHRYHRSGRYNGHWGRGIYIPIPQIILPPMYGPYTRESSRVEVRGTRMETPSECYLNIRATSSESAAMAFCKPNQPLTAPGYENVSEREDDMAARNQPPAAQPANSGAYIDNEKGVLCNDGSRPLTVLVDGREEAVIAPGAHLTLSRLRQGQVTFHY